MVVAPNREVCASEGVCGGVVGEGRDGGGESRSSGREERQGTANSRVVVLVPQTMNLYIEEKKGSKSEINDTKRKNDRKAHENQIAILVRLIPRWLNSFVCQSFVSGSYYRLCPLRKGEKGTYLF